ncbi:MAG: (Fe-S)-binding protein [Verrucomicrobiaceae bacterium]|nr:(Fe-S)-binding protein [Verrucomicrobiaceae bacterium]
MSVEATDHYSNCTHCGFCLAVCPTYILTGDENNSPRGRLRLWSEEAAGKIPRDEWTDFYTSECVGCLACETACPAHVPYGELFEHTRHDHVATHRSHPSPAIRLAAHAVTHQSLFNLAMLPARMMRNLGLTPHPFLLPGKPALLKSTAGYARELMRAKKPTGPRVALLTGCLMEAMFRDINFATVRVLIENNCQVITPENQTCCGTFQEHTGLEGVEALREQNRRAFGPLDVDAIVSNSSGCGYSLAKTLAPNKPVRDVLTFLGDLDLKKREPRSTTARLYVDLPCHLVHGQKAPGIPANVLDATGIPWALAPNAKDCCGSGGVYNLDKPENARAILSAKSAFLNEAEGDPVILGTANHVCMMQWHSAGATGLVTRPYEVKHVIQLLDPGEGFALTPV